MTMHCAVGRRRHQDDRELPPRGGTGTWRASLRIFLALLVLLVAAACGDPVEPAAPEPVALVLEAQVGTDAMVEVIAVEVTGSGIPVPIIVNLEVVDGIASGTVRVPPGPDRTFIARAFDVEAHLTHDGVVVMDVRPGQGAIRIPLLPRGVGVPIEVTLGSWIVSLAPETATLSVGESLAFEATVTDAEGGAVSEPQLTWASTNPAFLQVDGEGVATALHPGTAKVVVSYSGIAAEAELIVTDAVAAPTVAITTPADGSSFAAGDEVTFAGTATDGSGDPLTDESLVWTSSQDGEIGTGESFLHADLSLGAHTIVLVATDPEGRTGEAQVTITIEEPLVASSIVVTPATTSMERHDTQQFTATVYDQHGTPMEVEVSWSAVRPCRASVDEAGLATAWSGGSAQIVATYEALQGSATATVQSIAGEGPGSLSGDWWVCNRSSGQYYLALHLEHVEGETEVTGTLTRAQGQVATLGFPSFWYPENSRLEATWYEVVSGSERASWIYTSEIIGEHQLRGDLNDYVWGINPEVDLVRVSGPN